MSYSIEWLVPDHILNIVLPVRFDNAAIRPYDDELVAYLEQATQTLHLVVDVRSVDRMLVPSLRVLTRLKHITHPRLGWVVTIGMARTPFFGFLTRSMTSLVGLHIYDVASVEDALAYLNEVDKKV